MYFVFSALLKPLMMLVFLLLATLYFIIRKRKKAYKIFASVSVLWFLLISTPFIPDMLVYNLESGFPPVSEKILPDSGKNVKIMVMGAGHVNDFRLSYNNQLTQNALGRLIEGVTLYRKLPGSKIILSGWEFDQPLTQAQTLAMTAISLGVSSKDIILYNSTVNTEAEAREYARNAVKGDILFVVSNASHMPRVMRYFNKNGIYPIPVPCNFSVKDSESRNITYYFPESAHIMKSEKAMHEYIGMLVSYL